MHFSAWFLADNMAEETPLQALIAKYRWHMDFAELDLTDINQQSYPDDDALLHLVARIGGLDEVDLLVASGAQVNAPGDMGFTALHYAAMEGQLKMAKKLLDLGANPSIKNEWDQTAEVVAVNGGHADVAKLLRHNKYRNIKHHK